jgi:superfamily I DNA/RNA helicase
VNIERVINAIMEQNRQSTRMVEKLAEPILRSKEHAIELELLIAKTAGDVSRFFEQTDKATRHANEMLEQRKLSKRSNWSMVPICAIDSILQNNEPIPTEKPLEPERRIKGFRPYDDDTSSGK